MNKSNSFIDDRKHESEDYIITENVRGVEFVFYLPWYACFKGWSNDLFMGLDGAGCEETRFSTMLEF